MGRESLRRPLVLLIAFAAMMAAVPGAAAQQQAALPEEVRANIEARVQAGDHPGLVVGVLDGEAAEVYGFGETEAGGGETPDRHTLFEIGSVTKVFTALLLAEMAEADLVALDDPVTRYLPDSVRVRGGEAMTLRTLAAHTSGLPHMPTNFRPADPADPYADYTADDLHAFLASYALPRLPGSRYEYSNVATGLLGHVLARVAGRPYEALLRERVLTPLGLDETTITLDSLQRARLATGHRDGQAVPPWHLDALAGAGALRSTAADLLRFAAAQLDPEATSLAAAIRTTHEVTADAGEAGAVALGWHVRDADGAQPLYWHNGGTGGFRSFVGFDPAAGRAVVVLGNATLSVDDVGFRLLDGRHPLADVRPTADVPLDVLERYTGAYELAPTFVIEVTRRGERLYGQATGQPRFALYPASETRFFLKGVEAEITFVVEDDTVRALTLHQNGMDQRARKIR